MTHVRPYSIFGSSLVDAAHRFGRFPRLQAGRAEPRVQSTAAAAAQALTSSPRRGARSNKMKLPLILPVPLLATAFVSILTARRKSQALKRSRSDLDRIGYDTIKNAPPEAGKEASAPRIVWPRAASSWGMTGAGRLVAARRRRPGC